jgi:hypothetical protein
MVRAEREKLEPIVEVDESFIPSLVALRRASLEGERIRKARLSWLSNSPLILEKLAVLDWL